MTCAYADRDGSYVLGALAPAERLEFEQHLPGCATCARSVRELAGLPGLLARVDPAVLEPSVGDEPPPGSALPALLHAVRRARRRRSLVTAGVAAAAVAAVTVPVALTGALAGDPRPVTAPASSRVMAPVGDVPVRARLSFSSVAWGTRLDLTCTYGRDGAGAGADLPAAVTYAIFVRTREGRTQQVGTWRALDGRTMRLTAATAATRRDIAAVEVRTTGGRPVLELTS
jgi:hypothetical protein